mgnify:CR=1 FL=1
MQDNYPNIDKKFTDNGWAAMRDLLDEELPTAPPKRKRRGLIFFLLFLGIGVGIAIGIVAGGLYLKEDKPQEAHKNSTQPIAKSATEANSSFDEKSAIAQVDKETTTEIENATETAGSKSATTTSETLLSNGNGNENMENRVGASSSFKKPDLMAVNDRKLSNNQIGNEQEIVSLDYQKTTIIEDDTDREQVTPNDDMIGSVTANNIEKNSINPLKMNGLSELVIALNKPDFDLNLPELDEPIAESKKEESNKKGRLGLELGVSGAPNFAGISTGVVFMQPLKDKWSFQAGMNYAYQRRTFEGEPISLSDFESQSPNNPIENGALDDIYQGAYEGNAARSDSAIFTIPQNLSLHYLNIPLRLNYHLSDKWSIGGGVTGSVLLLASNSYTDGGLFNKSAGEAFQADDTFVSLADESRSINKANLQKYDVAANIGIGFHPSPKWSITANYHHGFKNLFRYSDDTAYNRFGNLSIQYYFGK